MWTGNFIIPEWAGHLGWEHEVLTTADGTGLCVYTFGKGITVGVARDG